jgi:hypothetical protein
MLNASIFEKVVLGGLVTSTAIFTCWAIFRDPEVQKEDAFKIRQELLKERNVKMLYSTMSFFYLQGFKSKDPQSFITLQTILNIEAPQIVALPLSKDDYEEKYEKAMGHPRFRAAMDAFKFSVKNKKDNEIKNVRDFNLKNLELLYLIDHCNSLKTCKVVYARKDLATYTKIDEAYNRLSSEQKKSASDANKARI